MAAYRASIEIGVSGTRALEELRSAINKTATAVDSLNDVVSARGALVQSIQNYTNNLDRAATSLKRVGAGTEAETKAVREYVRALGEANAARARQNSLVAQEIANQRRVSPGNAGFGQQGPALPPSMIRGAEIQQNWNRFFTEAQQTAQELQINAAAKEINLKNSWNRFFTEAQQVAIDLTIQAQKTAAAIRSAEGQASAAARSRLEAEAARRNRIRDAGFGVQGPQPARPAGGTPPPAGLGFRGQPGGENIALGLGFPLLFGGGAGQVAGGLAGSFFGTGFGGQILGSAIGQILEDAQRRIAEIGKALNELDMDKLQESAIQVTGELRNQVRLLIEAGKLDQARSAIGQQVAAQTGMLPQSVEHITNNVALLGNTWNEFLGAVSGTLSIIGTPFVTALTLILQGLSKALALVNVIATAVGTKIVEAIKFLGEKVPAIANLLGLVEEKTKAVSEEEGKRLATLQALTDGQLREIQHNTKLLDLETQRTAGRTIAEKRINAELDRQIALEKISYDFAQKTRELRLEYANVTSEAGQRELQLALNSLDALRAQAVERENIKQKVVEQQLAQEKIKQGQDAITESIKQSAEAADRLQQTQLAQVDNTMTVAQARLSAEKAVNSLLLQRAEFALNNAKTDAERIKAAREIYKITVTNAKLDYNATISTLKAEVRKASIAKETLAIKLKQLEATLLQAKAEGTITKDHYASLTALKEAYALSANQVKTASEVARFGQIEAKAIYDSSIYAADLAYSQNTVARQTQQAASAASSFAGSMSSAASSASRTISLLGRSTGAARAGGLTPASFAGDPAKMTAAADIYSNYQRDLFFSRSAESARSRYEQMQGSLRSLQGASSSVKAFARGGYVTGPTRALIGEGSEPEYIIPESKASNFAMNYLSGARGTRALNGSSNSAGPITIQTGPVIQQDGQNYVSVADLEDALQDLADMMLGNGRSAGARHYAGIN